MTYRARALHFQPTIDHVVHHFLDPCSLGRIGAVIHNACMEVSITDVAKDTGEKA